MFADTGKVYLALFIVGVLLHTWLTAMVDTFARVTP